MTGAADHEVGYDDVPRMCRDVLDEVYTPEGVAIWWNARNKMFNGERPRDVWTTPDGDEQVGHVVEYLTGGAW